MERIEEIINRLQALTEDALDLDTIEEMKSLAVDLVAELDEIENIIK